MSVRTTRLGCWLLAGVTFGIGCGEDAPITSKSSNFEVADAKETAPPSAVPPTATAPRVFSQDSPAPGTSPPATRPSVKPPVRPAPSGDPATDLLQALQQPPRPQQGGNREEAIKAEIGERIQMAEQVLQMETTPENRLLAVNIKLGLLGYLVEMKTPNAETHIREFCEALQNDSQQDIARLANVLTIGLLTGEFADDPNVDFAKIRDQMKSVLELPDVKPAEVQALREAALQVLRSGKTTEGRELVDIILATIGDHPELGGLVKELPDLVRITESKFEAKRDAFLDDEPDSLQQYLEVFNALLGGEEPGAIILSLGVQVGTDLEIAGDLKQAQEVYAQLDATFGGSDDEDIGRLLKTTVENANKRFALVGKPHKVHGNLRSGQPLDWSKYEGQVVLVHFWSPNSRASFEEQASIRQTRTLLQDRGFAVIGVAVGSPRVINDRLALQPLQWETIVDDMNSDDSFAKECGLAFVPFCLLLDAQGVVIKRQDINTLVSDLDAILPPSTPPAGTGKSDTPPADAPPADAPPADTPPADTPPADAPPADAPPADPAGDTSAIDVTELTFVSLIDDPPPASESDAKPAAESDDKQPPPINVYSPRQGLSPRQLIEFIFDMEDKPKSIQKRPGFGEAMVEAAERILAAETKDRYKLIAAETKFSVLHRMSVAGDEKADRQLAKFVADMRGDPREKIAQYVRFLQLERRVIASDDLELDEIPRLLEELTKFYQETELAEQHLRIASSTVHAINRLEDGDQREKLFKQFGDLFANSSERQLKRYGKRLAGGGAGPAASELVGKPLELEGSTALGLPLDWASYRGKVVIVDFWATWCGPCIREMPHVKAYYEKNKDRGFDIVGVSLDKDLEALAKFLEDNKIAWTTLLGDETQELAAKYGVRGIPTMMLVDRDGKVVAVSHKIAELQAKADELLADAAE